MRISDGSADVCSSDLMSRDFLRFIKEISDDADIRVAILTGAGRAFCVGGDLSLEDSFTGLGFQRELELYAETVLAILSSEARRVGTACVMKGRSRWSPYTYKNKIQSYMYPQIT